MKELLIPFGLERQTGIIVEPEDALKGRECNCLCPGCHAPLISRHPRINRIHFAHDSKHPDALPDDDCPLSPMVALMMMIKHIKPQFVYQPIDLPKHNVLVNYPCCRQSSEFRLVHDETVDQVITVADGGVFGIEGDCWSYDLVLALENHKILIEFFHPQKPSQRLPTDLTNLGDNTSILSIDCSQFKAFIDSPINKQERYSEVVKSFVLRGAPRVWRYHYKQGAAIQRYQTEHKCLPQQSRFRQSSSYGGSNNYSASYYNSRRDTARAREAYKNASAGGDYPFSGSDFTRYSSNNYQAISAVKYVCTICGSCFTKPSNERPYCGECKSHLTCRRIPG